MQKLLALALAAVFACVATAARADTSQEVQVEVTAPRQSVELSSPPSQTQVDRQTLTELPHGDQTTPQDLFSELVPGAVLGAQQRVFFRENEFGIRYEIDGIMLPEPPAEAMELPFELRDVDHLDILSGALPAEYGERVFSVVNVTTRSGTEKPRLDVELNYGSYNTFSPELSYSGTSGSGSFRYFLAASYHRTDRGLGTPQPASDGGSCGLACANQNQGGTDAVHDVANGNGEFAKLDWNLGGTDQLSVLLSNRNDFYQIPTYPATYLPTDLFFSPGFTDAFGNPGFNYTPSGTNDTQSETFDFVEAVWKHGNLPENSGDGSRFQLGVFASYYQVNIGNDPTNDLAALTIPALAGATPSSFSENKHANSAGLQADYVLQSGAHRIGAGVKLSAQQLSGALEIIGQNQNTSLLATYSDASPETALMEGVYLEDQYTISPQWLLNVGLRLDGLQYHFSDSAPSYSLVEPRVGLSYIPVDGTKLHAFAGRLFLPPWLENLREAFNFFQIGASSAPSQVQPEEASYFEAGVDQRIGRSHVIKVTAYYKNSVNLLDDAQLFNTSVEQPFSWAHGYAMGLEVTLTGDLAPHLSDFINYGFGVARGEGVSGGLFALAPSDLPTPGVYQTLDHVQLHTASAGLIYHSEPAWASILARFGSGLPTGPNNSVFLPSHLTFDVSGGYEFFADNETARFKLAVDLTNIFDDVYPISIANGFNGSYYAAGRELMVRLSKRI